VRIMKVTDRKKAPGLRMNEDETKRRVPALLGKTLRCDRDFISLQIQHPTLRGRHRVPRPVQASDSS